jgi:hypothetical protein
MSGGVGDFWFGQEKVKQFQPFPGPEKSQKALTVSE